MKKFLTAVIFALFAVSGLASAQVIGGVIGGYGQVVESSSDSGAGTAGGSIAIGNGIAGSISGAEATNVSAAQATQTLGGTTVITESTSVATQGNLSGSFGNAASGSIAGSGATGSSDGIAGQGIIGGFVFLP